MFKVQGTLNGANLMTKYVDKKTLDSDMNQACLVILPNRCASAPKLDVDTKMISKTSVLLVMMLNNFRFANADDHFDQLSVRAAQWDSPKFFDQYSDDSSFLVFSLIILFILMFLAGAIGFLVCYVCMFPPQKEEKQNSSIPEVLENDRPERPERRERDLRAIPLCKAYVTRTGECYHLRSDCGGRRSADVMSIRELRPCWLCGEGPGARARTTEEEHSVQH